jgi:superfamily II DNA or RNA helicase
MVPIVHIHKSNVKLPDNMNIAWATKVNTVAYDKGYQKYISVLAGIYATKGHKVLVVSDRVEFLKSCAKLIGDRAISITGENHYSDREGLMQLIASGEKNILLGTQSIFSEGISLNELSCIILATPINNDSLLTQLVGRILRIVEGKLQPVVADINLVGRTASKQAQLRVGLYMKMGWEFKII